MCPGVHFGMVFQLLRLSIWTTFPEILCHARLLWRPLHPFYYTCWSGIRIPLNHSCCASSYFLQWPLKELSMHASSLKSFCSRYAFCSANMLWTKSLRCNIAEVIGLEQSEDLETFRHNTKRLAAQRETLTCPMRRWSLLYLPIRKSQEHSKQFWCMSSDVNKEL